MHYEFILSTRSGRVGIIELNRPAQLNALNDVLMDELGAALLAFDADPGIGCIVIKGNAKAFAAGADVGAMSELSYAEVVRTDFISRNWETLVRARAVENLCYVVAAAQGGYHVGGREFISRRIFGQRFQ